MSIEEKQNHKTTTTGTTTNHNQNKDIKKEETGKMSEKTDYPQIDPSCFIAESAVIIGDVRIEKGCSIWPGAVLRADLNTITIKEGANVQDNCVIHVTRDFETVIGRNTSVGHGAIVHGARIGDNCIVGMNATVLDGVVVGNNCLIGAGAVVTPGTRIPDNSLVIGVPAKVVKQSDRMGETTMKNAVTYHQLRDEHKSGMHKTNRSDMH